jgi:hypothetical protein
LFMAELLFLCIFFVLVLMCAIVRGGKSILKVQMDRKKLNDKSRLKKMF